MIPMRVLVVLALAVAIGVVVDLLTGASTPGYGAVLGAIGVVALTVASQLLGRLLRRDGEVEDD